MALSVLSLPLPGNGAKVVLQEVSLRTLRSCREVIVVDRGLIIVDAVFYLVLSRLI